MSVGLKLMQHARKTFWQTV